MISPGLAAFVGPVTRAARTWAQLERRQRAAVLALADFSDPGALAGCAWESFTPTQREVLLFGFRELSRLADVTRRA